MTSKTPRLVQIGREEIEVPVGRDRRGKTRTVTKITMTTVSKSRVFKSPAKPKLEAAE